MKYFFSLFAYAGTLLTAHAQLVYTAGHADIGIGFEDETLVPHWHFHGGATVGGVDILDEGEYAPGDIVANVAASQEIIRPAGTQWDFLGVASGETLWYLPQVQETWVPFLGFGAEELDPSDWLEPFSITLIGKTGAGDFSLWANDAFGNPMAYLQTADGINSSDTLPIEAGGHAHYNWGFTAPGLYEVTLQFAGVHATLGGLSETATFSFNVVPEPGALALLLAAGGMFLLRRGRASA